MGDLEKSWAITQVILEDILKDIDKEFKKLGISFMPIKGAYLISTGLSSRLKFRKISDIDILVKREDFQTVSLHFSKNPKYKIVTWYADNYRPTETVFKYSYKGVEYLVEIMDRVNSEARFYLPSKDLFARSFHIKDNLFYPSPEDSLIIFICHLQSHIAFEFRDTNLLEGKILLEQTPFSFKKFWLNAEKTGMLPFIFFFMSLLKNEGNVYVELKGFFSFSYFLSKIFTQNLYDFTPPILRRILFDLPFVRKPQTLIKNKIFNKNEFDN